VYIQNVNLALLGAMVMAQTLCAKIARLEPLHHLQMIVKSVQQELTLHLPMLQFVANAPLEHTAQVQAFQPLIHAPCAT
jgi:hypothetical protein